MPIMAKVGNTYKEVSQIYDINGREITSVYAQNGTKVYEGKYPIATLTGVDSIDFKSDGTPLISWSMKGNGQQTGTPSPDNIIMPTFCGVRTGNLFDISTATLGKYISSQGIEADSTAPTPIQALNHTDYIEIQPNTKYTYHYKYTEGVANTIALCWFDTSKSLISRDTKSVNYQNIDYTLTATSPANAAFCIINFIGYLPNESMQLSFNTGSTVLPYEPYGWKEPITCAGQTVPVYLGQTQTVRRVGKCVLTGEEDYNRYDANRHVFRVTIASTGISRLPSTSGICSHFEQIGSQSDLTNDQFAFGSSYVYFRMDSITSNSDFIEYIRDQYAAGTPVTVWYVLATPETGIVNEPLAKIGDYADELHSTDAGVTISTAKGQNTLTVGTDLQPSQISVTGHIKSIS